MLSNLKYSNFAVQIYASFLSTLTRISPTLSTRVRYLVSKRRPLNLKNPRLFNERVSWLKLNIYNDSPLVAQCSDKYRVRSYVESLGLGHILNPLHGVYDSPKEIKWNELPNKYVLKWTTGAGNVIFCHDAKTFDSSKALISLEKSKRLTSHRYSAELQYDKSPRRIVCEPLIDTPGGELPADYKIYCYSGEPKFVLLYTGRGSEGSNLAFYDIQWNRLLGIKTSGREAPIGFEWDKPDGFDEAIDIAKSLSARFPFVRVDLYINAGVTTFGELTFTPCGGVDSSLTYEGDQLLGEPLNWLFETVNED